MGFEFRIPSITGASEKEQLAQIKSYLYQFIPQLQWALNTLETASSSNNAAPQVKVTVPKSVSYDSSVAFADLKPLIIKSADIVEAYYEEINKRLTSEYVAQSDFGTFIETNEQEIKQSSTGIEQIFSNMQKIITDIENLNFALAEVNAQIKSGVLYYDEDGLPVYGLEIGQKNKIDGVEVFNRYARFTSDKLSFYDHNGLEVAYISDRKLFINNVEITGSFKMGGFVETVLAGGSIVKRWMNAGGVE